MENTIINLAKAANEYNARQSRQSHPCGSFDKGSHWYPSDTEKRSCCAYIRRPSRAWPHSLNKHCRSLEHIAQLYNVDCKMLKNYLVEDRTA